MHSEPAGLLLSEIESSYDAVPRTAARVEHRGPFTLFIVNPLKGVSFGGLFSTHPPVAERVRRLRQMQPILLSRSTARVRLT